jgi:hypothetical protein
MPIHALLAVHNSFTTIALDHIIAGIVMAVIAIKLQLSESGILINTQVFPNIVLPAFDRVIVGHQYKCQIMTVQYEDRVVEEEVEYNLMFRAIPSPISLKKQAF